MCVDAASVICCADVLFGRDTYRQEGPTALFKGLGPTLVGVIPARSINFFSYGNGKPIFTRLLTNDGKENAYVHLASAATAGILTGTATNPIWVVKTRLQLEENAERKTAPVKAATGTRAYSTAAARIRPMNSVECIRLIFRTEGIKGFYRGLSASYLGVTEGVIQWTLYEQFKVMAARRKQPGDGEGYTGKGAAAGLAKLIATVITYPHEVRRALLSLVKELSKLCLANRSSEQGYDKHHRLISQLDILVYCRRSSSLLKKKVSQHSTLV